MKHEWKKAEKEFYAPKALKPEQVNIPAFKFFMISGEGNPNSEAFSACIQVLYILSYAVRMSHKQGIAPEGYFEYTVYPLEGVWDINEQAKKADNATLNKDALVYTLMIRQPGFVDDSFAQKIIALTKAKKPHPLLEHVRFESFEEGECIQMLHLGSYDDEPKSFALMEAYCAEIGRERASKVHREIYLTDARKSAPEKLKTILRFGLKPVACCRNAFHCFF